jgi:hypothetical protein
MSPDGPGQQAAGYDLSVVVPVYREDASLLPFLERTEAVLRTLGGSYESSRPLQLMSLAGAMAAGFSFLLGLGT